MPKVDYHLKSAKETWDEVWWKNDSVERQVARVQGYPLLVSLMLDVVSKNNKVLEGGCGLGTYLIFLATKGYDIVGIDYSELAVHKVKFYDNHLPLGVANVVTLPFTDDTFDVYLSLGVLEHFVDGPIDGLREAYRVLKPGGKLFITGPYPNFFDAIWRLHRKLAGNKFLRQLFGKPSLPPMHFWQYKYTLDEIEQYLIACGFIVERKMLWGHQATLWKTFPPLRSPESKRTNEYDSIAVGSDRLSSFGSFLCTLLKKGAPWVSALGWCIVAKK